MINAGIHPGGLEHPEAVAEDEGVAHRVGAVLVGTAHYGSGSSSSRAQFSAEQSGVPAPSTARRARRAVLGAFAQPI